MAPFQGAVGDQYTEIGRRRILSALEVQDLTRPQGNLLPRYEIATKDGGLLVEEAVEIGPHEGTRLLELIEAQDDGQGLAVRARIEIPARRDLEVEFEGRFFRLGATGQPHQAGDQEQEEDAAATMKKEALDMDHLNALLSV
jgi:hypothetical protein